MLIVLTHGWLRPGKEKRVVRHMASISQICQRVPCKLTFS